ncbi:lipopolysaccharide export system permease protein [Cereibacter ovatus]|uniref:Lipopolysaccharide export system permease protein n=1 Tax=Cereibacter ovatus TaxID=439529 RepID=A0A285CSH8_9RHOB|nr:LPS export ABC transporter permease LptF [Cereibacter ovatus]SNX70540.1 lipopolysaccharide export system permease protein [Cereibacter ovatus]
MSKFDRYLLSQLVALFGFFSLVLVLVYWINRAVGLFDELISDGQSALVFVEFSLLTLPNVIRLVLPISAFAATVHVVNRLSQESELVVMQATGFSGFRLARPVVFFGLIVALMMLALTNYLVPASRAVYSDRSAEIADNTTQRFLREGEFLHPARGVTLYIREVSEAGELSDLFLSDERQGVRPTIYSARRGVLVRSGDAPKLVMIDGSIQGLSPQTRRLEVTQFQDFTFDLSSFVKKRRNQGRSLDEISTLELVAPTKALIDETRESRAALLYEGHNRIAQPFLGLAAALIGFGALIMGSFSRFGLWWQILFAVGLLIVVQTANVAASGLAVTDDTLWPLAYGAPALGIGIGLALIWISQRPRRLRRAVRGAFAS